MVPTPALVKVQSTVSPGSRSIVAVAPAVVVPPSGSEQLIDDSVQPEGGPSSVTVHIPGAWTSGPFVLDSVPSASSSRLKAAKQLPEKEKSCGSSGTASLVILMKASLVFVKVHVTVSPAASPTVAVALAVLVPADGSTQMRLVSVQPLGAASLHV